MHRIDSDTKSVDLFGSGKHGYTEGNVLTGVKPTQTTSEQLNAFQEELAGVIEGAGLTLDKLDNTQLFAAIVALAGSTVAAKNYTDVSPGSGTDFNAICARGGIDTPNTAWGPVLVAVGDAGEIQTSEDHGASWTIQTPGSAYAGNFQDVAYSRVADLAGAIEFVAVGATGEIQTTVGLGGTWTKQTTAGAPYAGQFRAVHHDGTRWVAVGASGEIQTSSNATAWVQQTAAGAYAGTFNGVASNGTTIMSVGNSTEVQTSIDGGTTWVSRTATGAPSSIVGVAWDSKRSRWWIFESDQMYWSSDDGDTWNYVTVDSWVSQDYKNIHITPSGVVVLVDRWDTVVFADGVTGEHLGYNISSDTDNEIRGSWYDGDRIYMAGQGDTASTPSVLISLRGVK